MDINFWRQKKAVEALNEFSGMHTSLISLLVPPDTQIPRISKLLTQEIGTAVNIKSRVTKQSVLEALRCIQQRVKLMAWLPKNGLAIYCGVVDEDDSGKTRKMISVIEPIKPINVFTYRCDSSFLTEPLKDMLEATDKYGFIVMDGNGVLGATVQGNSQTILYKMSVDLPKKHSKGGQSSVRFARLRLEARHNYVKKSAELATKFFIDQTTNKPIVKGIVMAGYADFKEQLAKSLDPRLQGAVIDMVDIAYGGNQGLNQAIELSGETLKNVSLVQQKKYLGKFFDELSTDSGKACYGVQDTFAALEGGAVEKLLVWENLDIVRYTLINSKTGDRKVVHCRKDQPPDLKDSQDSEQPVWEIVDTEQLVDWLAEHFPEFGTQLELTQDSTPEGSQFAKGFGGIGGLLRYKIELPSNESVFEEEAEYITAKEDESDEEEFWN